MEQQQSRRQFLASAAGVAAGAVAAGGVASASTRAIGRLNAKGPIKIGLLNSLSGGLSIIEQSIHNASVLAIDEINAAGGINGRKLKPITEDYASDFTLVVQKAEKLVQDDHVAAVFGGYTSASRVSMVPVFERNNALLYYSTFYEGLECSPDVFYIAAVPTQQLFDYVPWVVKNLGKRIAIVGSDYLYPRTMSAIEKILIKKNGGTVVDDRYFPLGTTEFASVIASFSRSKPDVILSNMVGDSIPAFYKQFRAAGYTAKKLPIAATVTTEQEVQAMGAQNALGHYMSATYFQSLNNPANKKFVAAYKKHYGKSEVTNMPMCGMYDAVHLFAEACRRAGGKTDANSIRRATVGAVFKQAPEGVPVKVLPNHHLTLPALIGRANKHGQYDIIKNFGVRPADPFPAAIVPKDKIPHCPVPFKKTAKG